MNDEKDWDAIGAAHLKSIKRDMRKSLEDAAVRAAHKVMGQEGIEYPDNFIDALKFDVAKRDSEFFTHNVERPYDWSEWVCPDPRGYLLKCCDCGLVHEAEFGVVRYKSETEREDCDMVDDPNLQAVFRMRRSEQWSPADTAHRPGGLPMAEQPAQQQEPVAWIDEFGNVFPLGAQRGPKYLNEPMKPLYTFPPASKPWVGLTDEEKSDLWCESTGRDCVNEDTHVFADAIEAKLREKNGL